MTKPDYIPQDVWDAALKCAETVCRNLDYANVTIEVTAIARAIMAAKAEERERCLDICAAEREWGGGIGMVEERIANGSAQARVIPGWNAPIEE